MHLTSSQRKNPFPPHKALLFFQASGQGLSSAISALTLTTNPGGASLTAPAPHFRLSHGASTDTASRSCLHTAKRGPSQEGPPSPSLSLSSWLE